MEPAVSSGPTPAAALLRDVILGGTTVDLLHGTLAATRLVFGQVGSHDLVSVVDRVHQDEVQQDVLCLSGPAGEERVGAAARAASQSGAVRVEELARSQL